MLIVVIVLADLLLIGYAVMWWMYGEMKRGFAQAERRRAELEQRLPVQADVEATVRAEVQKKVEAAKTPQRPNRPRGWVEMRSRLEAGDVTETVKV